MRSGRPTPPATTPRLTKRSIKKSKGRGALQVYEKFLAPARLSDRIDSVGLKVAGEHLGRVTISIGVATLHINDMVERTDNCLYATKRHGRNRVMCETDHEVAGTASAQVA